ncbi:MAG: hypothetical protein PHC80_01815 [Eubacteriales bacterium]|nr:hypothetical protein [Eubacteriales bacterium]
MPAIESNAQRSMLAAYSHMQKLPREPLEGHTRAEKTENAQDIKKSAAAPEANADERAYEVLPAQKLGSAGLYSVSKDSQGRQEIVFDKPARYIKQIAAKLFSAMPETEDVRGEDAARTPAAPAAAPKPNADGASASQTIANTDRVDQEIESLKDKQAQLEKRLAATSDPEKRAALQNELNRLQSQLTLKDNDTYRRQNTAFTTNTQ